MTWYLVKYRDKFTCPLICLGTKNTKGPSRRKFNWDSKLVPSTYEGVSRSLRTDSITKYVLTTICTRWEATQRVMAAKLTLLTHKIAIQLRLVAESCTTCSSRSRRSVRKLLDTPSYKPRASVTLRLLLCNSGMGKGDTCWLADVICRSPSQISHNSIL
jgi:hypothetical protein